MHGYAHARHSAFKLYLQCVVGVRVGSFFFFLFCHDQRSLLTDLGGRVAGPRYCSVQ